MRDRAFRYRADSRVPTSAKVALVEEGYEKMQMNEPVRWKDNGDKELINRRQRRKGKEDTNSKEGPKVNLLSRPGPPQASRHAASSCRISRLT